MPGERTDGWSLIETPERAAEAAATLVRLGGATATRRLRQQALSLLGLKGGEIVVDVGAGAGVVTADLARLVAPGGRVFAVDRSAPLLERARDFVREAGVGHQVDIRVADARSMPFGAAFDAAVCQWLLLHVDDPAAVLAEMKRVTRRGGQVLALEMDWETAMVQPGEREVTRRILHLASDRRLDPWIGRRLPSLFAAAGFADASIHPMMLIDQGGEDRVWLEWLLEKAAAALEAAVITRDDYAAWTDELERAFADNRFFFGVVQFAVLGRVPA